MVPHINNSPNLIEGSTEELSGKHFGSLNQIVEVIKCFYNKIIVVMTLFLTFVVMLSKINI